MFTLYLTAKSPGCNCECPQGVCTCGGCFMGHYCHTLAATTLAAALVEGKACAIANDLKHTLVEAKVVEVTEETDIFSAITDDRESRGLARRQALLDKLKEELGQ